jgi:hypothetical protein
MPSAGTEKIIWENNTYLQHIAIEPHSVYTAFCWLEVETVYLKISVHRNILK